MMNRRTPSMPLSPTCLSFGWAWSIETAQRSKSNGDFSNRRCADCMSYGIPSTTTWSMTDWPKVACNRLMMRSIEMYVMSMPTHDRPSFCAASTVVPHPQNGSRTTAPGLVVSLMIRSSSAKGFWVG